MKEITHDLSLKIENLQAADGIRYLANKFFGKIIFSTSFGMEDQVITDMIFTNDIPVSICTLDTGRLFEETYQVMEQTLLRYKKTIHVFYPDYRKVEKLMETKGPYSFYLSTENRKECCRIRKTEPMKRALEGKSVWITGLRAEQSEHRSALKKIQWDEGNQIIKYHPLLNWTTEEIAQYIKDKHIPINILHERHYPSIGCAPCTRAVRPGENIRAGRWWWENSHKECGLHN